MCEAKIIWLIVTIAFAVFGAWLFGLGIDRTRAQIAIPGITCIIIAISMAVVLSL